MRKVIIETNKLKEMLESVKNAVSKEEFRPIFTGILLEAVDKKLTMTTCDGYKLFTNTCELIKGNNFTVTSPIFSIPKGTEENTEDGEEFVKSSIERILVIELYKIKEVKIDENDEEEIGQQEEVKGTEENTEIEIDGKFITFNFGNVKYSYKIIEGEFIDYKKLINRESKFSIRFNPKLLIQALRSSKGIVEIYFAGDRDAVIIKEINNENNQKYVLPCSKGN